MFQRAVVSARRLAFGVVFLLAAGSIPIHAAAPTNTSTPPPSITPPPFRSQNFQDIPHQSNGEALAPAIQAPEATSLYPWTRLAFQSIRDNNWEIYTGNDDGSGQTRLTYDGATDMQPRLNRGATRLVFASKRTGNYEIFAMNADGSGLAQLTSDSKDDAGPYWSPDGSKIVFQAYRDGQAEIYVMNADGSGQTRLTSNSGYDGEPAWSPDGSQIAFVSKRTGGQSDYFLWVMNADGSSQHQLVAQPYIGNPAWSPDGSKIAFDASGADGWQNLWVANADGSYPYILFDEGGYADAWAGSWSPDSQYIAFTRIYYTVYNNQLYWTYAYLDACGVPCYSAKRLSATGMDWRPDWQITDAVAPTSSMTPLLAQSPSPFTVRWSAFDTGTSGLQQYDLQVRDGLKGTWADWNSFSSATTSASYSGVGGHTYYFRVRAKDNAGNMEAWPADYDAMTTVEALPPNTAVQALPKYIKNSAVVYWGGTDPGNSGIQAYDVQYQDVTAGGGWVNWQISATTTSATFNGIVGHQYVFRSRGVDWAQNAEDWPLSEDTQATLYAWGITGHIYDNTGVPVSNAVITITPTAAEVFTSNAMGAYAAYVLTDTTPYTTTWEKNGYGSLPATGFGSHIDGNLAVYLPPVDNIILNGDFEMDDLATSGWTAAGEITPTLTDTLKLTGQQSIVLGTVLSQTGDSVITQVVTLPPTLAAPTLSFVYQPVSESSLTKNLVAYWKLDETSGTRIDATGRGNDLADNNTVASSPGKVGAAAQFVAANSEYLYCADTADLSTGDIDFTFAAWVYLDAPQTNGVFIGKGNADSSSMFEYLGGYNINDGMAVTMSSNTNTGDLSASAFGTPSLSQWYFVVAWHDAGNNQIGISVNGATNLLSYSSGLWDSTQSFFIGSDGGGRYWNGRVDEVGIWKRVLTADERDILYNGGQGCTYPFTTCGLFAPTQSLAAPSQFTISIDDGVTTTIVFSDAIGSTTKWTQQWVDISTWASQTVTITFGAEKGFGLAELVYIDDISLGSAHPDVWTQLESPQTVPPGGLATFRLNYGNQGGAPANGVSLTATLPAEFTFVDASTMPITTTPALVWDAGTLAGKSGPYSIVITATVSPTAPTFVNVISQSDVATSSDELETANNVSQGNTFIGHRIYLPLIAR